jgi:hypothetical protein
MKYTITGKKAHLQDTAQRINFFLNGRTVKYDDKLIEMRDEDRNRATETLDKLRQRIKALGRN